MHKWVKRYIHIELLDYINTPECNKVLLEKDLYTYNNSGELHLMEMWSNTACEDHGVIKSGDRIIIYEGKVYIISR